MRTLVREMGAPEAVQYMLGILGTLVAREHAWALIFLAVPLALVYVAFKHLKELQENTRRMLEEMAEAIDQRDPFTGGHSHRVTEFCQAILEQLPLSGLEADLIMAAARVHDIGKFGIPEELLKKPGALTPEERRIMQTHVEIGVKLLRGYTDFERGKAIVRHHHERWDGEGYPSGLKEQEIPLGARVIAVADSYDAMTSDRPYRRAFDVEHAVHELRAGRGTQWDPRIVDAFLTARAEAVVRPVPKPLPSVGTVQTA
jgi:putative nucleotidyltransferase with HDIG domain